MSPSRSKDGPAVDERALDEIAGELYALRPDRFIPARDEHVKHAREQGSAALARVIAGMRRPTQSAWLVNLLVRDQGDAVEELVELGDELRKAHQSASGADLQELSARRRKAEAALIRRVRTMAAEAGVDVTADMAREVEETLGAALVRPDVADEVRSGRLTKPVAYSGFGTLLTAVPASPADRRGGTAGPKARAAPRGRRAEEPERERVDAARRVDDARTAVEAATAELAEQDRSAHDAAERLAELQRRYDELQGELGKIEQELTAAERIAKVEARRRDAARKAHEKAEADLRRAEERLGG